MNNFPCVRFAVLLFLLLPVACAVSKGNVYPLSSGYLREEGLFARLKALSELNPALVRLHIIGFSSTENLPLYLLWVGRAKAPRKVLIIGQHHGDEVLGLELSLAWAEELARRAAKDKKINSILDEYQFFILPTINPEGFRVVSSGKYQYKRKTNRDTNRNGILDLRTDGVDLNRNYPVFWDEDSPVAVTHPNYKGNAPASEEEVKAVIALAQQHRFEIGIFFHSSASGAYSEKIFLPAIDAGNQRQQERYERLLKFTSEYAKLLKRDYAKGHYEVSSGGSSRVGNARNYFFHMHDTDAFLVEIGGINASGISVIHPPSSKKDKIIAMHVNALRTILFKHIGKGGNQ